MEYHQTNKVHKRLLTRLISKQTSQIDVSIKIYSHITEDSKFEHVKGHQEVNSKALSDDTYLNVVEPN